MVVRSGLNGYLGLAWRGHRYILHLRLQLTSTSRYCATMTLKSGRRVTIEIHLWVAYKIFLARYYGVSVTANDRHFQSIIKKQPRVRRVASSQASACGDMQTTNIGLLTIFY